MHLCDRATVVGVQTAPAGSPNADGANAPTPRSGLRWRSASVVKQPLNPCRLRPVQILCCGRPDEVITPSQSFTAPVEPPSRQDFMRVGRRHGQLPRATEQLLQRLSNRPVASLLIHKDSEFANDLSMPGIHIRSIGRLGRRRNCWEAPRGVEGGSLGTVQ